MPRISYRLQSIESNSQRHAVILLAVLLAGCALLLFLRHVNKEEEIHITQ